MEIERSKPVCHLRGSNQAKSPWVVLPDGVVEALLHVPVGQGKQQRRHLFPTAASTKNFVTLQLVCKSWRATVNTCLQTACPKFPGTRLQQVVERQPNITSLDLTNLELDIHDTQPLAHLVSLRSLALGCLRGGAATMEVSSMPCRDRQGTTTSSTQHSVAAADSGIGDRNASSSNIASFSQQCTNQAGHHLISRLSCDPLFNELSSHAAADAFIAVLPQLTYLQVELSPALSSSLVCTLTGAPTRVTVGIAEHAAAIMPCIGRAH